MFDLRGATAVVTGASRGIGPHICAALGVRGVRLGLLARSGQELHAVAARLGQSGISATPVPADLTDDAAAFGAFATAKQALGHIDILVNNAGLDALGTFHTLPPARIDEVLHLNLRVPMHLTRVVLEDMVARRRGHIVSVASAAGAFGLPYQVVYAATKAALIAFTRSIRWEYRGSGVSASAVLPTLVVGAGMYERERAIAPAREGAPWVLTTTAGRVARAVVRAIERDLPEVVVNRVPLRPVLAAMALLPGSGGWLLRALGVTELFRRAAARRSG